MPRSSGSELTPRLGAPLCCISTRLWVLPFLFRRGASLGVFLFLGLVSVDLFIVVVGAKQLVENKVFHRCDGPTTCFFNYLFFSYLSVYPFMRGTWLGVYLFMRRGWLQKYPCLCGENSPESQGSVGKFWSGSLQGAAEKPQERLSEVRAP